MADENDFKTPQLVITNAGLAAAQVATPVGPWIHISKFQIGSAFGYTPTRADQDINGELLFEGEPLTYKYIGDNTLDIVCRLPAEAGPFEFGEVALWLEEGPLFAKAAFATPQIKYSSLGTNVLSTYTFNCLLKLDQAVAVFKIDTNCLPPDIWEVDFWSDVYPAGVSANPDIPAILVREPDANGNASLIMQASPVLWSMAGNYHAVARGTVVGATTTTVDFARSELENVGPSALMNEYVLSFADGYLRACTSVANVGGSVRFTFTAPVPIAAPVGSKVLINSMLTNQTLLQITGGAQGSAIIKGKSVSIELSIDRAAALARSITFDVAGTYEFVVPDGVNFLYLDGGGAGAGGAGAGGGFAASNWPYPEPYATTYRGGGGGGGGGAGVTTTVTVLAVTPGETIFITVGKGGDGGAGGLPGNNGENGQNGSSTTLVGSFGTFNLSGGTGGVFGGGWGPPSDRTGDGGSGGLPGGVGGIDGAVGSAGGPGGTSAFGGGGSGGRGATGNSTTFQGASGEPGSGNSSGGGGGGSVYDNTSRDKGGDGGDGSDGIASLSW